MSEFHLESYALEGRIRISTIAQEGEPPVFETVVWYEDATDWEKANHQWPSEQAATEGHKEIAKQWEDVDLGACLECAEAAPHPSLGLVVDHQGFCVSDQSHSAVCASCTTSEPCEDHPYWCRNCSEDVFCERHFDEDA